MKKILLTLLAVLAMSGMAMAQTAPSDINLHRNDDTWSFIMPGRNLVMSTETFSSNDPNGFTLAGVPEGWQVLVLGETVTITDGVTMPITEGAPVTIVPTGNRRAIKNITLMDASKMAAEATAEDLGKVIGADGAIYDDASAATAAGTTALAMIAYVGSETGDDTYNHGLALALTDASTSATWCSEEATCLNLRYNASTKTNDMAGIANTDALVGHATHAHAAASAARGYNSGTHPTGTSEWFLPSAGQWDKMVTAAEGYANLKASASLQSASYWTSTDCNMYNAWRYGFSDGS